MQVKTLLGGVDRCCCIYRRKTQDKFKIFQVKYNLFASVQIKRHPRKHINPVRLSMGVMGVELSYGHTVQ